MPIRLAIEDRILEAIEAFENGDWASGLGMLQVVKRDIEQTDKDDDSRYQWAKDQICRHHSNVVTRIAEEIEGEWVGGTYAGSRSSMLESIEQSCDNACVHAYEAQHLLAASGNANAYADEMGAPPVEWSAIATFALRADVVEQLDIKGFDVNKRPPREAVVKCEGCDEWRPKAAPGCEECGHGMPSEEPEVLDET